MRDEALVEALVAHEERRADLVLDEVADGELEELGVEPVPDADRDVRRRLEPVGGLEDQVRDPAGQVVAVGSRAAELGVLRCR